MQSLGIFSVRATVTDLRKGNISLKRMKVAQIHSESGSLPADDSLGAEDHQRGFPIRRRYFGDHPETPVPRAKLRPVRPPFEHCDLVSQG